MPLDPCPDLFQVPADLSIDPPPPFCDIPTELPSQRTVPYEGQEPCVDERRLGVKANCDEMQLGHIVDDPQEPKRDPSRETITRYSRVLRGCDQAMRDLFSDVVVIDDAGTAHPVPIIMKTAERAVAWILQGNVRKDNTAVVSRLRLPLLSLYRSQLAFNQQRYVYHRAMDWHRRLSDDGRPGLTTPDRRTVFGTAMGIPVDLTYDLHAWTLYEEDMNQILEQVLLKFSSMAYIRVQGVPQETTVELASTQNNSESEPGDKKNRVIKYQFSLTVKTYIPQPIARRQAVNALRLESVLLGLSEGDVREVLERLEGVSA